MKTRHLLSIFALFLAPSPLFAAIDFETQVRPILRSNCFKCHGGPKAKKDFRMDKEDTLKEHVGPGKNIIPGKPEESELLKRVSLPDTDTDRMPPPDRGDRLEPTQLNTLRQWILEGALFEPGDGQMAAAEEEPSPAEPAPDKDALHTWVSKDGKELKAHFVGIQNGKLVVRNEGNREIAISPDYLSPESIELAKKLARQ